MNNYIVATVKSWNIQQFHLEKGTLSGEWHLVTTPNDLTLDKIKAINPRYIFFPHWSWIIPDEILNNWECVCFHMADVPYGRGGSPLQNLIVRGHDRTMLSALKMIKELDAGPVYKKEPLDLSGTAQQIFERMAPKIFKLIRFIAENEPDPEPQSGAVTTFKRRKPEQSLLPENGTLKQLYDHVRMLDADTYPKAFIRHGDLKIEFTQADLDESGELIARVKITNQL